MLHNSYVVGQEFRTRQGGYRNILHTQEHTETHVHTRHVLFLSGFPRLAQCGRHCAVCLLLFPEDEHMSGFPRWRIWNEAAMDVPQHASPARMQEALPSAFLKCSDFEH